VAIRKSATQRKKRLPKGFHEALAAYWRLSPEGRDLFDSSMFSGSGLDATSMLLLWGYSVPLPTIALERPTEPDRRRQAVEVATQLAEWASETR
jgi:hypothetical protein